jgi:hypothetical protein
MSVASGKSRSGSLQREGTGGGRWRRLDEHQGIWIHLARVSTGTGYNFCQTVPRSGPPDDLTFFFSTHVCVYYSSQIRLQIEGTRVWCPLPSRVTIVFNHYGDYALGIFFLYTLDYG